MFLPLSRLSLTIGQRISLQYLFRPQSLAILAPTRHRSSCSLAVAPRKPVIRSTTPQRVKSPATQFSQSSRPWAETRRRNCTRPVLRLRTWGARRRLLKSLSAPIAIPDPTWRSWRQRRLSSLWVPKTHSEEKSLRVAAFWPERAAYILPSGRDGRGGRKWKRIREKGGDGRRPIFNFVAVPCQNISEQKR